uniref:Mitochondrial import inner membrane translocase subunit TIM50 n=1 Tax=Globodera pallida TaxID=36090 RepID=A0A183BQZ1_GLOPA
MAPDCLEYVVFENHVASIDGLWRLHDRVYPKWLKPKQASTREGLIEEADREKLPERPVKLHVGMGDKMKEFRERSGGN